MPLHGIGLSAGVMCITTQNITHVKHLVEFWEYTLNHVINCTVMRWWNFTAHSAMVHAYLKQTKGQPSPGKKNFAFWKLRAAHEGFLWTAKTAPASQPL